MRHGWAKWLMLVALVGTMAVAYTDVRRWPKNHELFNAVSAELPSGVTKALRDGADPNARLGLAGMRGGTAPYQHPLHLAVQRGNTGIVRLLLEAGADANRLDNDRRPLEIAAQFTRPTVAVALLEAGANPALVRPGLRDRLDEMVRGAGREDLLGAPIGTQLDGTSSKRKQEQLSQ